MDINEIYQLIKKTNVKQIFLSREMKVTPEYISTVLSGRRKPSDEFKRAMLKAIEKKFVLDVERLKRLKEEIGDKVYDAHKLLEDLEQMEIQKVKKKLMEKQTRKFNNEKQIYDLFRENSEWKKYIS